MAFDQNAPFEVVGGFDPNQPFDVVAPRTKLEAVKDTAIDFGKGVVGYGESLVGAADIVTGNAAGKGLSYLGFDPKKTKEILSSGYSQERQVANEHVASANGFMETLGALVDKPSVAFGAIVESAPMSLAGVAAARFAAVRMLQAAKIEAGTTAATKFFADPKVQSALVRVGAAAEGAQTAGSIQESGRQAGREWQDTVAPALAAGAGTAAIGVASSKIPGFRDAEATVASAGLGAQRLGGNLLASGKEIAKSMFKEGWLEELPQSMQEQIFTNLAMDKPWDEGVGAAGAQGAVAGMGQGGGMTAVSEVANGLTRIQPSSSPAPQDPVAEQPPVDPIAEPQDLGPAFPPPEKPKGPLATIASKIVERQAIDAEALYGQYEPELPGTVPADNFAVTPAAEPTMDIPAGIDPLTGEIQGDTQALPDDRQVSMPGRPYRSEVFKKEDKAQRSLANRLTARIIPTAKEYAVRPVAGGFQIHEVGEKQATDLSGMSLPEVLRGLESAIPRESQRAKEGNEYVEPAADGRFNPGWFRDSSIKRFDAQHGTAHAEKIKPLKLLSTLRSYLNGRQLNETQRPAWDYIKDYADKQYGVEVPEFGAITVAAKETASQGEGGTAPEPVVIPGEGGGTGPALQDVDAKTAIRITDLTADPPHVAEGMDNPDTALDFFEAAIPQEDRATMADVFAYIRKNGLHRQTSFAQQLFNMVGGMYSKRTGKQLAILGGNADNIGKKEAPNELTAEAGRGPGVASSQGNGSVGSSPGADQGVARSIDAAGAGTAGTSTAVTTPDASDASAPSGEHSAEQNQRQNEATDTAQTQAVRAIERDISSDIPSVKTTITIEPNGSGIIVKGDMAQVRAKLADAGVEPKGLPNAKKGGLFFPEKQAGVVRAALESQNTPVRETQKEEKLFAVVRYRGGEAESTVGTTGKTVPPVDKTKIFIKSIHRSSYAAQRERDRLIRESTPSAYNYGTDITPTEYFVTAPPVGAKKGDVVYFDSPAKSQKETTNAQTDTADTVAAVAEEKPGDDAGRVTSVRKTKSLARIRPTGPLGNEYSVSFADGSTFSDVRGMTKEEAIEDAKKQRDSQLRNGARVREIGDDPWKATQAEYVAEFTGSGPLRAGLIADHRAAVEQALSEGKPVPAEVLADYPDLTPQGAIKARPSPPGESASLQASSKPISETETAPDYSAAASVMVRVPATIKETGQKVFVEESSGDALKYIEEQEGILNKILDCVAK